MNNYFYLNENKTIKDAFFIFNKAFGCILCVENKKKRLVGILTEGDLRRAILKGFSIKEKLKEIISKKYTFIYIEELQNKKFIKSNFNAKNLNVSINFIPIINNNNNVIRVLPTTKVIEILEEKSKFKGTNLKPNILIVGGAGYIGTILAKKLLSKNYRVTILDKLIYDKSVISFFKKNKNLKFIKGDICDLNVQINCIRDIDVVVFLAEIVGDPACNAKPEDALKTNYLAVSSFSHLCSLLNISKFIYTSSCSVYGVDKNNNLLNEQSPLNPVSHYARIKIMSEKALLSIKNQNFCPTVLRLGTVFGPSIRDRFDLVVNTFAKFAHFNKKIDIHGGNQWRPNICVEDVADGIIAVIKSNKKKVSNEIFNLSSENLNYRIKDIAKIVKKKFKPIKINYSNSRLDIRNYRVSCKKFELATNFKAKKTIEYAYDLFLKKFRKKLIKNPNLKKYSNIATIKLFSDKNV